MCLGTFRYFLFITALLFNPYYLKAQDYSTRSKKAIKLYEEANQKMHIYDYVKAIEILGQSVKEDNNFTEAWLLMADAYDVSDNREKVVECCRNALRSGADKYPVTYFFLSQALYKTGKYEDALSNANIFLEKNQVTSSQRKIINKIITDSNFALITIQHPVPFIPVNLGDNINTKYDEYWPSLSADEEMMAFTRLIPKNENSPNVYKNRQEDLFYSMYKDNSWQKSISFGPPLNTMDNEGAQFLTSDGKTMFFTACNRSDGLGKCDIYISEKLGNGWSVPVNLGEPVNSGYSEKQPSLSSDGKSLYFSSNRPGGKGNYDIWVSVLDENGKWTNPVNLGDSINTPEDEQSPFIHPDNQTLYFSSNGWPGMGGHDLYFSRRLGITGWSKPVNLGYPINTFADEVGIVVNARGDHAYFSSNRIPEKGRDIFEFDLYPEARPLLVSYLKGKVFNAENRTPLDAKFELIDLKSSQLVNQAIASKYTGEFLVCIPTDKDYDLNVSKTGFLFYSENFTLSGVNDKSKPYIMDIPLQPIKAGNKTILKNIFFETNSYELKPESAIELNKLAYFIVNNPTLKIEISGHTDNIGTENFNRKLSENRAKTVVGYLISKGIPTDRLLSKGYGKTQPISDNNTEEGRAQNRRTEFKIIGN